jgi:hypothetical protein
MGSNTNGDQNNNFHLVVANLFDEFRVQSQP